MFRVLCHGGSVVQVRYGKKSDLLKSRLAITLEDLGGDKGSPLVGAPTKG